MVDVAKIESAVRAQSHPPEALFRRHGVGWQCIVCPGDVLTQAEYSALMQRLNRGRLSPAEIKRNAVRAKGVAGHD